VRGVGDALHGLVLFLAQPHRVHLGTLAAGSGVFAAGWVRLVLGALGSSWICWISVRSIVLAIVCLPSVELEVRAGRRPRVHAMQVTVQVAVGDSAPGRRSGTRR